MSETEDYNPTVTPDAHAASHQDAGSDEISILGLSGLLADPQPSTWALVSGKPTTFAPSAHKTSHQDAGADEISVLGLSGLLADPQPSTWALVSGKPITFPPEAHKTSHEAGGSDIPDMAPVLGINSAAANLIFAGPVSGVAAAPTFRALVDADFPVTLSPTFAGLIVPGISPASDFILTQNSVAVMTSIRAGAEVNTLYFREGLVGIGVNPQVIFDIRQNITVMEINFKNTKSSGQGDIYMNFDKAAAGNSNGFRLRTGGFDRWIFGTGIIAIDDNFRIYQGQAGVVPFTIEYTGAVADTLYLKDGTVRMVSLAGTGTRHVVVDANGVLSAP